LQKIDKGISGNGWRLCPCRPAGGMTAERLAIKVWKPGHYVNIILLNHLIIRGFDGNGVEYAKG
jgi:hypothetical protein